MPSEEYSGACEDVDVREHPRGKESCFNDTKSDVADVIGWAPALLNSLRLLVALDALLVMGSVSEAARYLSLGVPAMSRLLAQLRRYYDDPIMVRTGQGMVPTVFAESLRLRVRAVASEAGALLDLSIAQPRGEEAGTHWRSPAEKKSAIHPSPPLAMRPATSIEGEPHPDDRARNRASMGLEAGPQRRLARAIALIGSGPGQSRPLTREETEEAFSTVLEGGADPVQIGALLTLMRSRGLTADELVGLVAAGHRHCGVLPMGEGGADLDWPIYVSPMTRMPPWFLYAAKLVAQAGYRVLLHGYSASAGALQQAIRAANIPVCEGIGAAQAALSGSGIAYLPVGSIAPQVQALLGCHSLFEMRTPLHMMVPMLNPLGASASLLGVCNPSYPTHHRDAARLLGGKKLLILGAKRDVAQSTPFRTTPHYWLVDGVSKDIINASQPDPGGEKHTYFSSLEYFTGVWAGRIRDEQAKTIIVETVASALQLIRGHGDEDHLIAISAANALWADRSVK